MDPEIIKPKDEPKETGCCFRSCGGVPCISDLKVKPHKTTTDELLEEIK